MIKVLHFKNKEIRKIITDKYILSVLPPDNIISSHNNIYKIFKIAYEKTFIFSCLKIKGINLFFQKPINSLHLEIYFSHEENYSEEIYSIELKDLKKNI